MNKIIQLEKNEISAALPLFGNMGDTSLLSCMQGRNFARVWADDAQKPSCAAAMVGGVRPETCGFAFFGGKADCSAAAELVRHWYENAGGENIIVPQDERWERVIESALGEKACKHLRYATDFSRSHFDKTKLAEWAQGLPQGYTMRQIDRDIFDMCLENKWSVDCVGNFADYAEFVREGHGMGFAVLFAGEVVCAASPYSAYDKGIEIEIDTREDHRRRGLARACAAKLILACLDKGIHPNWDAANSMSIALAESLGFVPAEIYNAYFCDCAAGKRETEK